MAAKKGRKGKSKSRKGQGVGKPSKRDPNVLSSEDEAFCSHYVLNGSGRQAYMHAFPRSRKWKPASVDTSASTLLATPKVQQRLAVLRLKVKAMADEEFEIDARWVLKQYAAIANLNVPSVTRWGKKKVKREVWKGEKDKDGRRIYQEVEFEVDFLEHTPSGELTEEQAKCVASAKMNVDKFGNSYLEIAQHDKLKALEKLAQFTGLSQGKIVHEHTGKIVHATEPVVKQIEDASDERDALKTFEAFRISANSYAIERNGE